MSLAYDDWSYAIDGRACVGDDQGLSAARSGSQHAKTIMRPAR
jgi:hypothetical protein